MVDGGDLKHAGRKKEPPKKKKKNKLTIPKHVKTNQNKGGERERVAAQTKQVQVKIELRQMASRC